MLFHATTLALNTIWPKYSLSKLFKDTEVFFSHYDLKYLSKKNTGNEAILCHQGDCPWWWGSGTGLQVAWPPAHTQLSDSINWHNVWPPAHTQLSDSINWHNVWPPAHTRLSDSINWHNVWPPAQTHLSDSINWHVSDRLHTHICQTV
jgi:hypothetical protein